MSYQSWMMMVSTDSPTVVGKNGGGDDDRNAHIIHNEHDNHDDDDDDDCYNSGNSGDQSAKMKKSAKRRQSATEMGIHSLISFQNRAEFEEKVRFCIV